MEYTIKTDRICKKIKLELPFERGLDLPVYIKIDNRLYGGYLPIIELEKIPKK